MKDFNSISPIYHIGDNEKKLIKNIEKNLSFVSINDDNKKKNLKIKSRVRSIYSSLAIENNSLSLNNVENIINDKKVLGKRKEIQEVINASLEKTTQKNEIKFNKNQKEITKLIQKNPNITRNEIAKIINITVDGVKYNLNKLVSEGIIERIVPNNGGYWKVKS